MTIIAKIILTLWVLITTIVLLKLTRDVELNRKSSVVIAYSYILVTMAFLFLVFIEKVWL